MLVSAIFIKVLEFIKLETLKVMVLPLFFIYTHGMSEYYKKYLGYYNIVI